MARASLGLAALALAAGPLTAQEIDQGRLAIEEGNRRVATESFRVWRANGAINAWGQVTSEGAGPSRTFELIADDDFKPVQYLVRVGEETRVRGSRTGDRFRVQLSSERGERWKEFLLREPLVALDKGVAHQHLLLVRALEAGGGRAIAIVPSDARRAPVTLAAREATQLTLPGGPRSAVRFDLRVGDDLYRVWVGDGGELLRVHDPHTGLTATRLP